MASYLTQSDADTLAATMVTAHVAAYVAASSAQKTAALIEATARIDAAMKYQGRKYDPGQALEFPRVPYDSPTIGSRLVGPPYPTNVVAGITVWDWDSDAEEAVVPDTVKRACVLEASSILDGKRDAALDAQARGLASQAIGSASESYTQAAAGQGADAVLCRQAMQLLERYRLRSGAMR